MIIFYYFEFVKLVGEDIYNLSFAFHLFLYCSFFFFFFSFFFFFALKSAFKTYQVEQIFSKRKTIFVNMTSLPPPRGCRFKNKTFFYFLINQKLFLNTSPNKT